MTKLSELKAGDRFTIVATIIGPSPSDRYIDWRADGAISRNSFMTDESMDFVLWDGRYNTHKMAYPATTEHYEVISEGSK